MMRKVSITSVTPTGHWVHDKNPAQQLYDVGIMLETETHIREIVTRVAAHDALDAYSEGRDHITRSWSFDAEDT